MNRPRIFLSAVSAEFRTTRKMVAATLRTRGFDPVSQDDFPTGHGELSAWLRSQIDTCEGVIQIIGQAYGAEPQVMDADFGRVSYTQYELLYARRRGKKTWIIIAGDNCFRDNPLDQLDLPEKIKHSDPSGFQNGRRQLQQAYLAKLKTENHIWHEANSDDQIKLCVSNLRDDLDELRKGWEDQRLRDTRVINTILVLVVILLVVASIAVIAVPWIYQQMRREVLQVGVVDTQKIRSHLLETIEQTHQRELADAGKATDWRKRQQLRDEAEAANKTRLSRIEDLMSSISEIENRAGATAAFQEMIRILNEQGVDEAIAFVASQRSEILQTVHTSIAAEHEHIRAELQPLLKAAALYESKGQPDVARANYHDILAAEPDWPEALSAAFWFQVQEGCGAVNNGALTSAQREFQEAQQFAQRLAFNNSTNTGYLSMIYISIGDVNIAQGDLTSSLTNYQKSLAIVQKLVTGNLSNAEWQRALSINYQKIGNVEMKQGDLTGALNSYHQSLAISKMLAAQDSKDIQLQMDLSLSLEMIGSAQNAVGDLAGTLKSYQDCLVIRTNLAAKDASNTEWQRDLSDSYTRIGAVLRELGDLAGALTNHQASLAIAQKLAKIDPSNIEWQRDLSVSFEWIGDLQMAENDLPKAIKSYQDCLAIRTNLAAKDLSNTDWQHDLSDSYDRIGKFEWTIGDLANALTNYQDCLAIRTNLAARDVSNADWQHDLAANYQNIGNVKQAQKDFAGALKSYQDGLAIQEKLVALNPGNTQWQRDLSGIYFTTGAMQFVLKAPKAALQSLLKCQKIQEKLGNGDANLTMSLVDLFAKTAYFFEIDGQFSDALEASAESIKLVSLANPTPAAMCYAHALLFTGDFNHAKEIYLKFKGRKIGDGRDWNALALYDLRNFIKKGLTNEDIVKIEALLN